MKLKKAIGFISGKFREPSVCEQCGEEFTCGASLRGCWCRNVELTDKTREELKSKFTDCLCPNCLEKLSGK